VRRIQGSFNELQRVGYPTSLTLFQIAGCSLGDTWQRLDLWPAAPRDDLQFWLFCAWHFRKLELRVPEFMLPVTDLSSIEPQMNSWDRGKQIQIWKARLKTSQAELEDTSAPLDFRLMILPKEAPIQWRREADSKFKDLKATQWRRLVNEYGDAPSVLSEALPLWLAIYHLLGEWDFKTLSYQDPEVMPVLNAILQIPTLAEKIVNVAEQPLARPAERLQYRLDPARDESDDYSASLVLPDGSAPPEILAAVPGPPALYLTTSAVYQGPPPHDFSLSEPLRIPAPALESSQGIRFLQRCRIELPQRLVERVHRVKIPVKLSFHLMRGYRGEYVGLQVTSGYHSDTEVCAARGWQRAQPNNLWQSSSVAGERPKDVPGKITVTDDSLMKLFPRILEPLAAKWESRLNRWEIKVTKKFPETFVDWLRSLPPELELQLDSDLATLRDAPVSGSVDLNVDEAGVAWFDLKVAINVSDTQLTQEELKLLLNARGDFVRLGKKGWRRLQFNLTQEEDETLARLGLNARDFTAEPQRLHALQLADIAARKFLPEAQAEQIHRRVSEIKTRVVPPVPTAIRAELRPYQIEGFHFLAYLTANHFGGVLADDMGLGKTVQTLAWLAWLRGGGDTSADNGSNGNRSANSLIIPPSLVVCPKSVMDNWRTEAERFCAGLRVRLWQGEEATTLEAARPESDLIVINYAQLRSLSPEIARHRWQAAILDEAQYIKNPDSQTAQAARALQADHRLALTGTPIENRLLDLWSIFAFAMPGALGNRAHFTRSHNQSDDPLARRRLAARVRPFLLRRAKGQVAQDLPDRVEEDIICEMEGDQKTLYRAEFKRAQQLLLNVTTQKELNEQRFNFLTSLLRLRQICCHPALVNDELRQSESAKVTALLDLLEPILEQGHKVLVFSQFVTMLDLLRITVQERGWTHFYLAGDTENRGQLVSEFQSHKGPAIFLISLKAGGFGLNLTAASYVVMFDPWWNPAVENQAIDRTHRIGQTSKVIAYRLLIKDSIEQKIRQLQQAKTALAENVLGEERFSQSLTIEDLRFLFSSQ
jgi:SNF2 family DNA or RNA helicase